MRQLGARLSGDYENSANCLGNTEERETGQTGRTEGYPAPVMTPESRDESRERALIQTA